MSIYNRNSFWYIDIGNSSISIVSGKGHNFGKRIEFRDNEIPKLCLFISKSSGEFNNKAIICSVVPEITKKLSDGLKHYKLFKLLELGKNIPLSIKAKYHSYHQLGNDRKANVFAALKCWKPPFIILDCGTATTVDYVSKQGVFEGGLILPGVKSCLDLLHEKTALLPPVRIKPVRYFLGRSTQAGMLSGVLHGYGAMIRGLIAEFRSRYGQDLKTIGTGGLVDIVEKYCGDFDHTDQMLTLRGIRDVYEDWCLSQKNRRQA